MNMNGMEYFNTSKVSDRIAREDLPLVIGEIENENKFEVGVAKKWYKSHKEEVCAIVDIVKEKKLSLSNPDVTQFDLAVFQPIFRYDFIKNEKLFWQNTKRFSTNFWGKLH